MAEARAGNIEAFGTLVELTGPTCYRLCYAILRSHADAEDAAQEAFVKAWRQISSLRDVAAWTDWMHRIALHSALDVARRRDRRQVQTRAITRQEDFAAAVVARTDMETAFLRLSPDDRSVLVLRFYLDLQVPQIATFLHVPMATAKTRLYRAIDRLRDELRQSDGQ